ncbi:alkyl hydroperoxide reductase/ Thiol specific antioxidant/ Mal allergen, partial [mine drainage metagenome]
RGDPLVLWWVATWCSSCTYSTQLFAQSYYSQYHSAGVTLLEIESYNDLGQSGPSLSSFASSNGYSGQAGWVFGTGSASGTSSYNPSGYLDYYYAINAQGTIVAEGADLAGSFSSALQAATGS